MAVLGVSSIDTQKSSQVLEDEERLHRIAQTFSVTGLENLDLWKVRDRCFRAVRIAFQREEHKKINSAKTDLVGLVDSKGRSILESYAESRSGLAFLTQIVTNPQCLEIFYKGNASRAMHLACAGGFLDIVQYLETQGIGSHMPDQRGLTPILAAVDRGQRDVVEHLVSQHVFLKAYYSPPQLEPYEFSPFSLAVMRGEIECLDILISGSTEWKLANEQVAGIGNLLHVAVHFGQNKMLKHLLYHYHNQIIQVMDQVHPVHHTPLAHAASLGDIKAISSLLEKGATLEERDRKGRTAWHIAAIRGQIEVVKFLAYRGCKVHALAFGKTALNLIDEENSACPRTRQVVLMIMNTEEVPGYPTRVENLVFKGGGNKGICYIGAVQAIEELKIFPDVLRVAGTSAGAITAGFIALGCSSDELQKLMEDAPLMKLMDHPFKLDNLLEKIKKEATISTLLDFAINPRKFWDLVRNASNPLQYLKMIANTTGLCEGEDLLNMIETVISKKTNRDNCTFGELNKMIQGGKSFKHLHVFCTEISSPSGIICFSSEDPKCASVIISHAIRASAGFPLLFKPHCVHQKLPDGQVVPGMKFYIDGGLLRNLPIEVFDRRKYFGSVSTPAKGEEFFLNRRTIAFDLVNSASADKESKLVPEPPTTLLGLISAILEIYASAEELIRSTATYGSDKRIIQIDTKGAGTIFPEPGNRQKAAMIRSGYTATYSRLTPPLPPAAILKVNLPPPLPFSVDRKKLNESIQLALFPLRGGEIVVLKGRSGSGKTELACNFALSNQQHFSMIAMIHCKTDATMHKSYLQLGKELGLGLQEDDSLESLCTHVHNHLESTATSRPRLLIFDDVEAIPSTPKSVCALLIPKNDESLGADRIIEVGDFEPEEAHQYLREILPDPDEDLKALGELFGYFPMTIGKVAAYLEKGAEASASNYIEKITALIPADGAPLDFDKTQQVWTLKRLKEMWPASYEFLLLSAHLNSSAGIPIKWVQKWVGMKRKVIPREADRLASDLVDILEAHNVIRFGNNKESFSLHSSMQESIQGSCEGRASYEKAFDLTKKMIQEFLKNTPEVWEGKAVIIDHAEICLASSFAKSMVLSERGDMYFALGEVHIYLNNFSKALDAYTNALRIRLQWYHPDGSNYQDPRTTFQNVSASPSKDVEILNRLLQGLDLYPFEKVSSLSPISEALDRVGWGLQKKGHFKLAIDFHNQAWRVFFPKPSIEPNQLSCRIASNLSEAWLHIGNYQGALTMLETAFGFQKKLFSGKDHPDVLRSCLNLARVHYKLSQFKQASNFSQEAFEMGCRLYPAQEDSTIVEARVLKGNICILNGIYPDALVAIDEANNICTNLSRHMKNHTKIAEMHIEIAKGYQKLGRFEGSLQSAMHALQIYEKAFSGQENHIKVALAQSAVAKALSHLERFDEALTYHEKAQTVFEAQEHHLPEHASILSKKGYTLLHMKKPEEALKAFLEAFKIRKVCLAILHPLIAQSHADLARACFACDRLGEAHNQYSLSLSQWRMNFPNQSHYLTSDSLLGLGFTQARLGQTEEALSSWQDALKMRKEFSLNPHHPRDGRINYRIGKLLYQLDKLENALFHFDRALEIARWNNSDQEKISEIQERFEKTQLRIPFLKGKEFYGKQNYKKALSEYKRAYDHAVQHYGDPKHPEIVKVQKWIDRTKRKLQSYNCAIQ